MTTKYTYDDRKFTLWNYKGADVADYATLDEAVKAAKRISRLRTPTGQFIYITEIVRTFTNGEDDTEERLPRIRKLGNRFSEPFADD